MKSSIACLVLAAGVSAQQMVQPQFMGQQQFLGQPQFVGQQQFLGQPQFVGQQQLAGQPVLATPYYARRPAPATLTEEEQAAARAAQATQLAAAQAAQAAQQAAALVRLEALQKDWATTQAAALKAASSATKADLTKQEKYYKYLATNTGNSADTTARYKAYAAQIAWERANTDANKALAAFDANPTRATSLASEAASATANYKLMAVFGPASFGAGDGAFGKAGRFGYQNTAANMEIAEDSLKAAGSRLAFNDDSTAYFNALDSYKAAEATVWGQTLDMQGKAYASLQLSKQQYFSDYNSAYDRYAANPTSANTEKLGVAELDFLAEYMGYRGTPESARLDKYLDYQSSIQKADYAKRDAQAIIPAFVQRNQNFNLGGR